MIAAAGLETHFMALVPQSGWDNYYAHMARRLEDSQGFFADKKIKLAFHREIDVFTGSSIPVRRISFLHRPKEILKA